MQVIIEKKIKGVNMDNKFENGFETNETDNTFASNISESENDATKNEAVKTEQKNTQSPDSGYFGSNYNNMNGASYSPQGGNPWQQSEPPKSPYGYYGNGGYYTPYPYQTPQRQSYQPQRPPVVKKEKKPASKGFVCGAVAIGLVLSFLVSFATSAFFGALFSGVDTGIPTIVGGNEIIVQHAPKDENPPVVTDKGNAAYVASIVSNSVVEVTTETVTTGSVYGQYITQGAGSGVIISSSDKSGSYIITCAHVIDGANKITVKLKDGTVYEAASYICDTESDVGVIKLNVSNLPCATIGDFSKVVVGEEVIAIGNPLGTLGGSVTSGIVSALDRDIIIDGTTYHLLQTNAEINPGNSGGGLFNTEGHLIGIVNAKSSGEDVEGLGFAIPIDDAEAVMTDLLEKGYVSGRVKLGFQLIEVADQEDVNYWWQYSRYFTDYGVYIITSESPDFLEGDLIVAVNTDRITNLADLKALLQKFEVGETVSITVSRITSRNKVEMFTYQLTLKEKTS